MPGCSVKGCGNYSTKTKDRDIQYFSFPKDHSVCNRWIEACNRDNINIKNARVCSIHFTESSFVESYSIKKKYGYPANRKRYLKEDALPTESLPQIKNLPATSKCIDSPLVTQKDIVKTKNMPSSEVTSQASKCVVKQSTSKNEIPIQTKELNEVTSEARQWKIKAEKLMEENTILTKRVKGMEEEMAKLYGILNKYFTTGQIKMLKKGGKKVHWTAVDICSAMSLRSICPEAYRYLKKVKGYPLPALSTLRRWASTLDLKPDVVNKVPTIQK